MLTSSMAGCAQSRGTLASRLWGPDRVTLKQVTGKMVSFVSPGKKKSGNDSQLAKNSSKHTGRVKIASLDTSADPQAVQKGNVLKTFVSNHPGKYAPTHDPFLDEDNRIAAAGNSSGSGEENARTNPFTREKTGVTREKTGGSQPGFASTFDGQMARLRAAMRNETKVANAFPSHPGPAQVESSRPPVIVAGPVAGRRDSRFRQPKTGTTRPWPAYDYQQNDPAFQQNDRSQRIAERDRRWYSSSMPPSLARNGSNLPPTWMPVESRTHSNLIRRASGYAAGAYAAVNSQYEMIIDNDQVPTREETRRLNTAPQSITYPELHPSNPQDTIRLIHGNDINSRGTIQPTGGNRPHRNSWHSGNVTVTGFSQIREADGMRSAYRTESEVGENRLTPRPPAHAHSHAHTVVDEHALAADGSVMAANSGTGHSESLTPPLMSVPRDGESGSGSGIESVGLRWLVFILAGIGSVAVIVLGLRRRSQIRI